MKLKFEAVFRGYVVLLAALLIGAVWADAQVATNRPAPATNTVDTLARLSANLGVEKQFLLSFGLDQYEMLRQPVFGNPIWKYLAFTLYVLLAWLASRLVDFLFQRVIKRWTARTETTLDDLLVELMHGPVKVITFVILLHVGLNVFAWPDWVAKYLSKGLKLVVAWSITYMAVKAVDVLMQHLKNRAKEEDRTFDAQVLPVISKTLKIFLVLVAVLVTAQNLDFNITGILASLSIGGLALGLAAQDTLANLFGAIAIFADKPFRVGERIRLEAIDGTVERIGLRSTCIRNLDGHLVAVPNKTVGNATITNVSRRPNIRTVMNIGITYETSPERIKLALAILEEIYRGHPQTEDVIVGFDKFLDYSLNIQVVHWWKGLEYKEYVKGMQELNLAVKQRFDEERIEFAFPTQTHYIKNT
jgi:MscS family membrane protein